MHGLGFPLNPDYNGASQAGVGYYRRVIDQTRRAAPSCWRARAIGVTYRRTGQADIEPVTARKEVVVSAGAANSPKLLQLSSIGEARPAAQRRHCRAPCAARGGREPQRPLQPAHRCRSRWCGSAWAKPASIGGLASEPQLIAEFVAQGARYVSSGADLSFILAAGTARAKEVRAMPATTT
ncbi:MAG: GMC family oxidoreductase N-terminal domain-containing protein [Acetobacteraceae bacterium]